MRLSYGLPSKIGTCHIYRDEVEELFLEAYPDESFVRNPGAEGYTRFADQTKFYRKRE